MQTVVLIIDVNLCALIDSLGTALVVGRGRGHRSWGGATLVFIMVFTWAFTIVWEVGRRGGERGSDNFC